MTRSYPDDKPPKVPMGVEPHRAVAARSARGSWIGRGAYALARFGDRMASTTPAMDRRFFLLWGLASAGLIMVVAKVELGRVIRPLDQNTFVSAAGSDLVTSFAWSPEAGGDVHIGTRQGIVYRLSRDAARSSSSTRIKDSTDPIVALASPIETNKAASGVLLDDSVDVPGPRRLRVESRVAARGLAARLSDGTLLTGDYASAANTFNQAPRANAPRIVDGLLADPPSGPGPGTTRITVPGGGVVKLAALPKRSALQVAAGLDAAMAVAGLADGSVDLIARNDRGAASPTAQAALGTPPFSVKMLTAAHPASVSAITVAAAPRSNGASFATAAADGSVRIWRETPDRSGAADALGLAVEAAGPRTEWVPGPIYRGIPAIGIAAVWPDEKSLTILTVNGSITSADFSSASAASFELGAAQVQWMLAGMDSGTVIAGSSAIPGPFDAGATIVDNATGRTIRSIGTAFGGVLTAAADRPRRVIALATADRSVRIYAVSTGALLQTITIGQPAEKLAYAPSGALLAIAGAGQMTICDAQSGAIIATYRLTTEARVLELAWSKDGKTIALGYSNGSMVKIGWRNGADLGPIEAKPTGSAPVSFAASGDGRYWMRSEANGRPELIDIDTGRVVATLGNFSPGLRQASIDETGDRIWVLDSDGAYRLWSRDLTRNAETMPLPPLAEDGLRLSSDGTALLARTQKGQLFAARLVDQTGAAIDTPKLTAFEPDLVALDADLSADGAKAYIGGADGLVRVRPLPWAGSGSTRFDMAGHGDMVHHLSVSPDGTHLISASIDGRVRLVDLNWARRITSLPLGDMPTGPALEPMAPRLLSITNPVACQMAFQYRRAGPWDFVCVTPQKRALAADENRLAADRRSPDGGDYGPNTCKVGYVWREAFEGDVVCVTPDRRTEVKAENAAAAPAPAAPPTGPVVPAAPPANRTAPRKSN